MQHSVPSISVIVSFHTYVHKKGEMNYIMVIFQPISTTANMCVFVTRARTHHTAVTGFPVVTLSFVVVIRTRQDRKQQQTIRIFERHGSFVWKYARRVQHHWNHPHGIVPPVYIISVLVVVRVFVASVGGGCSRSNP